MEQSQELSLQDKAGDSGGGGNSPCDAVACCARSLIEPQRPQASCLRSPMPPAAKVHEPSMLTTSIGTPHGSSSSSSSSAASATFLPPLSTIPLPSFNVWKPINRLIARPGNVGVQIDTYRTLKMFHRPRTSNFTAHFHGLTFEDTSMENYERLKERQARKSRLIKERVEKLKQLEAKRLEEEDTRIQRRIQREMDRQLRLQQRKQSAHEQQQKQKQEQCALVIQRHVRGLLARGQVGVIRHEQQQQQAAYTMQRNMKRFVQRQQSIRERVRVQEEQRRGLAAVVVQRQVRKHQSFQRYWRHQEEHTQQQDQENTQQEAEDQNPQSSHIPSNQQRDDEDDENEDEDDSLGSEDLASPAVSIELLFTDDDISSAGSSLSAKLDELCPPVVTKGTATTATGATAAGTAKGAVLTTPHKPKHPPSFDPMRRVGGGFRHLSSPRRTASFSGAASADPVATGQPLRRHTSLRIM